MNCLDDFIEFKGNDSAVAFLDVGQIFLINATRATPGPLGAVFAVGSHLGAPSCCIRHAQR
jgi:hypothetical protein